MTAPERIWAFSADDIAENEGGATIVAHESYQSYATEYIRADLAAIQPAQVKPDCCDICRGGTFAETSDGKGWRCVECKAIWLRAALEPQADPRDEVIKGLATLAQELIDMQDWTGTGGSEDGDREKAEYQLRLDAALAAAKAVQHG